MSQKGPKEELSGKSISDGQIEYDRAPKLKQIGYQRSLGASGVSWFDK